MAAPRFPTTGPVALVLSKLRGVEKDGPQWKAKCPGHADNVASLGVKEGTDGRCLLNCRAGCAAADVARALGLTMADLFADGGQGGNGGASPRRDRAEPIVTPTLAQVARVRPVLLKSYDYRDADGDLAYQVCRMEPKGFRQRRPDPERPGEWIWKLGDDVPRLLYRLPDVLAAASDGKRVFVVEGEKDADALVAAGYDATTGVGGANGWRDAYADALRGAEVVVLPDHDEPGAAYAASVAASCHAVGCEVKVVALPGLGAKQDVSDWLDQGHTFDELEAAVAATPRWFPPEAPRRYWRLSELWENDAIMRPPPPVVPRLAWAGRSTMLAAREKAGKSTLVGCVAAAVTRGGPFLGESCVAGDVLVIGLEEYLGDVARRLRHFNADPARVLLVDRIPGDPRERPRVVAELVEEITPALVIVDTLFAFGRGLILDENKAAEVGGVVQALTDVAHHTGTALLLSHHAKKEGGFRGSTAGAGAVDVLAEMHAPDPDADPTRRKFKVLGRVPAYDFECRYVNGAFVLAGDRELPLDERVIQFVRDVHPGASVNELRKGVGGSAAAVDACWRLLLEHGRLVNNAIPGSGRFHFHVPATTSATRRDAPAPSLDGDHNAGDWWQR